MDLDAFRAATTLAMGLQALVNERSKPPSDIAPSPTAPVIYVAMVRGTRGYIEKLAHQINGTYANGWYDACAVMIRRLVETLIIEAFEAKNLQHKIKDAQGNYFMLGELVSQARTETSWTLGRKAKAALSAIKDVGDQSAHSRRFTAHREDIDLVLPNLRTAVQELIYLAGLK